ncbi:hypothetical protein [Ferruginibacter albus]|uniref:hypothetical protein n=1 Tax=Ferruginibacter albus TaxID=2875540 RepID=UPI001CC67EFE|nr:hypothetical protein [Ferruginibacter albus]UAY53339.1 hypothetical protein K9M53_06625 [Ferruginibacter albus]
MKKIIKILLVIVLIGAAGGVVYWQMNKKKIVKDAIQNAVTKGSDNLYSIHYDSSSLDEINGNARFYNVTLQADSIKAQQLNASPSKPNVFFNVYVQEVGAIGMDIPGMLANNSVSAKVIYLKHPVLKIINNGSGKIKTFSREDTLSLYKQLLGKYKSIKADTIRIIDGDVLLADTLKNTSASFEKINIDIHNFLVDSMHNYTNIVSYFIKDVEASVGEIKFPGDIPSNTILLNNVVYNAAQRFLNIQRVRQYNADKKTVSTDILNINIDSLNTNAFIIGHQLKAGMFTCGGGTVTITIKKNKKEKKEGKNNDVMIELSDNTFNMAQLDGINIKNTNILLANAEKPDKDPIEIHNVQFKTGKVNVVNGNTLSDLVNNAQWQLTADGFSFNSENKFYKTSVNTLNIENNAIPKITVKSVQLKPLVTEDQYGKMVQAQKDLYDFDFNNIVLTNVNIKNLIANNSVEVNDVSVQALIRIFNDRTLPERDTTLKIGTYPHQAIMKLSFPLYIKKLTIINGFVHYREKGSASGLVGNVAFENLNAVITNLTNMPDKIKKSNICTLNAHSFFVGKIGFNTKWVFPLDTKNGTFTITGQLDTSSLSVLNPVVEPLGLMSITKGSLDRLTFKVDGNDRRTLTNMLLLYHDLDMDMLKKPSEGSNELRKKGLATFVANIVVKDNNPQNNETRTMDNAFMERNIHTPFFGTVWASIFTSAKKIALAKKAN